MSFKPLQVLCLLHGNWNQPPIAKQINIRTFDLFENLLT